MTKVGPNLVKATFYMNAEVARPWDVQIADIYHRQMNGLSPQFYCVSYGDVKAHSDPPLIL